MRTLTLSSTRIHSAVDGDTDVRGLIDTNIVVHLNILDAAALPGEMVISTVTLAELSAGPHHADDHVERARRMSILQHAEATFEPLPLDAEAGRAYGLITAAVLAVGRKPRRRIADLLIASIAYANKLPLYTMNPNDFTGLEELVTIKAVKRPS